MRVVADLQLHSKYSRAVSQKMILPEIGRWAMIKRIDLMATGDWTHPLWYREIVTNLVEKSPGLFSLKESIEATDGVPNDVAQPMFLLSGEVSSIYTQGGKQRRIHNLIFAPSFATVDKINKELTKRGCNLMSDGRPIIGLTSINIAELVFSIDNKCLLIPAHAWTPWFSLYGSKSGFDTIEECFGEFAKDIYAVETGLSSDPAMNWRIKDLDNRTIISCSDAHSGPKLGREATVFELNNLSYRSIREAIIGKSKENKIAFTIEFYPEEGKYHYTGHRLCNIRQTPQETLEKGDICPVCKKPLTVGVMHRVNELASRSVADLHLEKKGMYITSRTYPKRPPYIMIVPLMEIVAESIGSPITSPKVVAQYLSLTSVLGGEFTVLLKTPIEKIKQAGGETISMAVDKVRRGDIVIEPGYDGVFGVVKIFNEEKVKEEPKKQLGLF